MRCSAVACCLLAWCASISRALQCPSPKTEGLKFSLSSKRNESGHWIGQVALEHGAGQGDDGSWDVDVDVDHTTVQCDGEESVRLVTTLTAPPRIFGNSSKKAVGRSYKLFPGLGYYKLHTSRPIWHKAREICATEEAHLVILNSEAEWAAVKQMWDEHPSITTGSMNDFLHVGMTDFVTEKEFVTLAGEPVKATGYNKWGPGEPNSGTSANCGAVKRNGDLYDSTCTNEFAFACEIEL